MAIKNRILDGDGSGNEAHVTSEKALLVTELPYPPLLPQKNQIFKQYLTDDGTPTGDEDMRVVASLISPADFYIKADDDDDCYITTVSFVIADEAAKFSLFGAIAALTNGCRFFYESDRAVVDIAYTPLRSNWDFVRMSLTKTPEGEMKVQKDVEGKVDAYVPVIDFTKIMPPFGIKLDRGSNQRLVLQVRDDTTNVDSFNAVVYGFNRFL